MIGDAVGIEDGYGDSSGGISPNDGNTDDMNDMSFMQMLANQFGFGNQSSNQRNSSGNNSGNSNNKSVLGGLSLFENDNQTSATASNQDMFDMTLKTLQEMGIDADKAVRGGTYDANSAWTDPVNAWDMNRLTTLLKKKQVRYKQEDSGHPTSKPTNKEQPRLGSMITTQNP